jgi:hypothetical protein
MRQLLLFFYLVALVLAGQADAKESICTIVTGYGTSVGTAPTPLEAKAQAREICSEKLIDMYLKRNRTIDDDRIDDLILACINLECEK